MSKATLELKNVSKLYRVGKKEVHALNPISFDLLGDPARSSQWPERVVREDDPGLHHVGLAGSNHGPSAL